MSAITGIFMRNGKNVDPELMKKMNKKLSHRGPDGSDIWCEGPIGLGHQMLWTTPESLHEQLPYEENGLVITADARIDNRDELSKELDIKDEENVSDSYFILKAYQMWGEECPDKLLGDFAFAIWDKVQEKLFCARDHMGVKPFYYYLDDDMFVFGTELKALFANLGIQKKINELRIADYLTSLFEDKEITFYEKVKRLPAAFNLVINFDKTNLNEYWLIDLKNEIHLDSNKEYSDAFRDIFTESVRCRLRSAFPIGSMLSGGLDSSSIVCTARKILDDKYPLNTFSAIFNDVPQSDESNYINLVLKENNINANYIHGDKISPLSDLDKMIWHLDEPLFAPNLFINWNIYNKTRKNNIRVILDGFDGDSTISHGEKFLVELAFNLKLKTLFQEIKGLSNNLEISKNKLLYSQIFIPSIPTCLKPYLSNIMDFLNIYQSYTIMKLNEDFILKSDIKGRRNSLLKQKNTRNSRKYHYFNISSGIQQFALEVLNKSASAFSIELRCPFFDKRLIEFCLLIPTEQKIFKGWDRIILRRAMQDILPQKIQWRRKKANFGPNFKRSFLLYEKEEIEKVLFQNRNNIKNYVDMDSLKDVYDNYIEGKDNKNIISLWKTVNLSMWLDSLNSKE